MPTPAKAMAQMDKHMTDAERAARDRAESEILPEREGGVHLVQPPLMAGDAKAKKYWVAITDRMEGYVILDDLDSETLGIYCVMLSRYDSLVKDIKAARSALRKLSREEGGEVESALGALASLTAKAQKIETTVLQYADKLGLTPAGRVRLAQKRAEQAAAQADPDGDLFGD